MSSRSEPETDVERFEAGLGMLTMSARSAILFAVRSGNARSVAGSPADLLDGLALESGSTAYEFLHRFPRLVQRIETRTAGLPLGTLENPSTTPELRWLIRRALDVAREAGSRPGTGHLLYALVENHVGTRRLIRSAGLSPRKLRLQLWTSIVRSESELDPGPDAIEVTMQAVLPGPVEVVWNLITGFQVDLDVYPRDFISDVVLMAGPEVGLGRRTRYVYPGGQELDAEVVRYEEHARFVDEWRSGGTLVSVVDFTFEAQGTRTLVNLQRRSYPRLGNLLIIAAEREGFRVHDEWSFARLREMLDGGWPASVTPMQTPMPMWLAP